MTPSSSNIAGLPLGISFSNGSSVSYGYGFTRDWCSDAICENGTARMLLHEEGYLDLSTGGSNPPARFFVKDHLGSVRAVVAAGGAVQESTDYYPLGGMFNASGTSVQPHKFSGKEWDSFSVHNTFDFGARTYDPYTGRWLTQDPLANKYFAHSPYVYCAGNPVRYVDLDGRKIFFAKDATDEFKAKFAQAIAYMNKCGTSYNIAVLEKSEHSYYIKESEKNSYFPNSRTITWNPNIISADESVKVLRSPITSLAHEFGHARNHERAELAGKTDAFEADYEKGSDPQYGTKEERNVITTTEQYAARRHGEISENMVTRVSHKGRVVNSVKVNGKEVNLKSKQQEWISNYVGKYNKSNSGD